MEKEQQFNQYNFDSDETWLQYRRNVEFFGSDDTRLRRKYYKNHVDSDFEVNARQHADESTATNEEPSQNSAPPPQSSNPENVRPPPQSTGGSSPLIDFIVGNGQITVLVAAILYALSTLFGAGYYTMVSYYGAMLSAAVLYFTLALQAHGRPRPTWKGSPEYWGRLLSDDNAHYFLYSVIFLTGSIPVFVTIIPVTSIAAFQVSSRYHNSPFWQNTPGLKLIVPYMRKLINMGNGVLQLNAKVETYNIFFLLLLVFTSLKQVLQLWIYSQYLSVRYRASPYSQQAWRELAATFDVLTASRWCPGPITWLYGKIRGIITNMGALPVPPANRSE